MSLTSSLTQRVSNWEVIEKLNWTERAAIQLLFKELDRSTFGRNYQLFKAEIGSFNDLNWYSCANYLQKSLFWHKLLTKVLHFCWFFFPSWVALSLFCSMYAVSRWLTSSIFPFLSFTKKSPCSLFSNLFWLRLTEFSNSIQDSVTKTKAQKQS